MEGGVGGRVMERAKLDGQDYSSRRAAIEKMIQNFAD